MDIPVDFAEDNLVGNVADNRKDFAEDSFASYSLDFDTLVLVVPAEVSDQIID